MWTIEPTEKYKRDQRWYEKKRRRELEAVLDNLDSYVEALQLGTHPLQVKAGFIHPEPHGVVAIDQKGGRKSLAETRLYVYPDTNSKVLYLIALGDKNTQKADIKLCNDMVAELRKGTAEDHDAEDPIS